jgi:uncharacterized protein GlcG (DUF336 family)
MPMKLKITQKTLAATRACAHKRNFKPLAVAILEARAALLALAGSAAVSRRRNRHRRGKRWFVHARHHGGPTVALGRCLAARPWRRALSGARRLLIRTGAGELLGAVAIAGETSDSDAVAAVAGIAGSKAHPGA